MRDDALDATGVVVMMLLESDLAEAAADRHRNSRCSRWCLNDAGWRDLCMSLAKPSAVDVRAKS
jgi:hypothetical protein